MAFAELEREYQNIALLLLSDEAQSLSCAFVFAEPIRSEMSFVVVMKLPRGADFLEDKIRRSAILFGRIFDFREKSG